MIDKVIRFRGNTKFVPKETGNFYIDGDQAVLIDQAGHEFVFSRGGGSSVESSTGESSAGASTETQQSGGTEYVESWPENPVPNKLYVTTNGARVYYGENGQYVELAVSGENMSHETSGMPSYPITVIPGSTTEYILFDSASGMNNGSWHYYHIPESPSLYTLPNVDDKTVEHWAVLTIIPIAGRNYSPAFRDESDNLIPIMSIPANTNGAPVSFEYRCRYNPITHMWFVTSYYIN